MIKDDNYYANTLPGRAEIRLSMVNYHIRHEIPERICRWIAFKLHRDIAMWAMVRIASATLLGDERPDHHTYEKMFNRWDKGLGR